MNKSLMISIRPKHAYNIITGKKTIELRKWIPKDYVGWVYVYVTKTIRNYKLGYYYQPKTYNDDIYRLHGNIPFRFWFDETYLIQQAFNVYGEPLNQISVYDNKTYGWKAPKEQQEILKQLCLTEQQVLDYGKGKDLYAWHIKKLEIFDEPKYLSEFYKFKKKWIYSGMDCPPYVVEVETRLSKAPQRSVWVYTKELEK